MSQKRTRANDCGTLEQRQQCDTAEPRMRKKKKQRGTSEQRDPCSTEAHYRRICQELLSDAEHAHEENQRKIQLGMRWLFWLPLVFLTLVFLTDSEKVIFLVLWIASLFLIAGYLIYIEYTDFYAQEKVRAYVREDDMIQERRNLIGNEVEVFEENVDEFLDNMEERRIQWVREKIPGRILRRETDGWDEIDEQDKREAESE